MIRIHPILKNNLRALALGGVLALHGGCVLWPAPPPGPGAVVTIGKLPGWNDERQAEAWPALLRSCERLAPRTAPTTARAGTAAWEDPCRAARALPALSDAEAREFFERWFVARVMNGDDGRTGLITGYYEPILNGSLTRSARYRFPLHRRPDNLLTVDLGSLYPELRGKTVRGRLEGQRVVPYFSRAEITAGKNPLAGQELLWVDDAVEAFVLQVQGSGRVRLEGSGEVAVGYADQNGHPYRAIGARLIERGALTREEVTLPRIRAWLAAHPEEAEALLHSNPSYVFFTQRTATNEGPLGSQGVALSAGRSIAVDASWIPLGTPVWLDTTLPDGQRYQRLVIAQDTGGAIKGAVRADIFFGQGAEAGQLAGEMKHPGRLTVLVPKAVSPSRE